jgi:biofilm PGA synthesis N-glycosyltransferase PgaC
MVLSVAWSYAMLVAGVAWVASRALPAGVLPPLASPLVPQGSGLVLGATCVVQFAFSSWLDGRHDRGLKRNLFWMIWYPLLFWLINAAATVAAFPKVLARGRGSRARWVSPDRGIRP